MFFQLLVLFIYDWYIIFAQLNLNFVTLLIHLPNFMENLFSFNHDFFDFVDNNLFIEPNSLLLKYHNKDLGFDLSFAITQIESRKKTEKKLRSFIGHKEFLFPTLLSAEQASNEAVALFHSSLINDEKSVLDMTAGLGIDAMTFATSGNKVTACEIDPLKARILEHNVKVMGIPGLKVMAVNSVDWLNNSQSHFDLIFIDPARRTGDNKRAYNLHDCMPDIIEIEDSILRHCDRLLIKASPLLDISQTIKDIRNATSIRAICVNGECKEILIEARGSEMDLDRYDTNHLYDKANDIAAKILKEAVDLSDTGEIKSKFSYLEHSLESDKENLINYASHQDIKPGCYLYEPNAALMKLSPWKELCKRFESLKKLAPSTHLFVSDRYYADFPGRKLRIVKILEKKDRKTLKGFPANVVVRNYPLSATELRKQLGVKEGTDNFIYGTRLKNPILILAIR